MSKKIVATLLFFLTLHVFISIALIVFPSFLARTRFSRIYKTNLSPGPFFSDGRIENNYLLSLSWKINDQWSEPINPSKKFFDDYVSSFNPSYLYKSRFERSLYQRLRLEKSTTDKIQNEKEFAPFKNYLRDKYVPVEADSFRVVIIRKRAKKSTVKTDTLHVFTLH